MSSVTDRTEHEIGSVRMLSGAFAFLRIFSGLIWLCNGLAKLFFDGKSNFDWGFITFNLIDRATARAMLERASTDTFQPLRWIYHDLVLANWGFFQWFLTVAELTAGLMLLFGIAARLGATIALLLIGPIWIMALDRGNLYLFEYPNELVPLLLLAIVPSGRVFGQDRKLAPRFNRRWPF
jgi:uncharacterized membrane protein YphA (DoxX/SURF4 family)